MRRLAIAISLCLTSPAAADDDAPTLSGMTSVAADAAVCAALRGDWTSTASDCTRKTSSTMREIGALEVWQVSSPDAQRWGLVLGSGAQRWMSPPIEVPTGEGCGAGHCSENEIAPALRVIHPHGRPAAVLDLTIARRTVANESPRPVLHASREELFIACGTDAHGARSCTPPLRADGTCVVRLRDDGAIVQTCQSIQRLSPYR
jgi:hypothetical protein